MRFVRLGGLGIRTWDPSNRTATRPLSATAAIHVVLWLTSLIRTLSHLIIVALDKWAERSVPEWIKAKIKKWAKKEARTLAEKKLVQVVLRAFKLE